MFNSLLVIGMFDDGDLQDVLKLIHPVAFDENYVPGWNFKYAGKLKSEKIQTVTFKLDSNYFNFKK